MDVAKAVLTNHEPQPLIHEKLLPYWSLLRWCGEERGEGWDEKAADRQGGQTGKGECRLEEDGETMVGPNTMVDGSGNSGFKRSYEATMLPCLVRRRWLQPVLTITSVTAASRQRHTCSVAMATINWSHLQDHRGRQNLLALWLTMCKQFILKL